MAHEEPLLRVNGPEGKAPSAEPPASEPLLASPERPDAGLLLLVQQAQQGSHAAFEAVVLRFQGPVQSYLAHLIGDDEQARDLTQDTFWLAWKGLSSLRDPALFRPWLFQVATNRGRSWLRHHRLIGWVSLDWLAGARADSSALREPGASLGEALHAPESRFDERLVEIDALRQALSQVPAAYRACLLLHLSLGFTVPEVAEQLGLTTGAVRMRLFRGLERLRRVYTQEKR
jgi:RNA polymerase sigma-70 factor (ECF subfamily)